MNRLSCGLPIQYAHYILYTDRPLSSPEAADFEHYMIEVANGGSTEWVDLEVSYADSPVPTQPTSSRSQVLDLSLAHEASVATWEYAPPQPALPPVLGPGEWQVYIAKTRTRSGDVERHSMTIASRNEVARQWLRAQRDETGHSPPLPTAGSIGPQPGFWELQVPRETWRLETSLPPRHIAANPNVRASEGSVLLTQQGRAELTVELSPHPFPLDSDVWTSLAHWHCAPGPVRLVPQEADSRSPIPDPIVSGVAVEVTLAIRADTLENRSMLEAGLDDEHDLRIHLQYPREAEVR